MKKDSTDPSFRQILLWNAVMRLKAVPSFAKQQIMMYCPKMRDAYRKWVPFAIRQQIHRLRTILYLNSPLKSGICRIRRDWIIGIEPTKYPKLCIVRTLRIAS
jgi:hypothetical protein